MAMSSSSRDTMAPRADGGGTFLLRTFSMVATGVAPAYGFSPTSSSYSSTPAAKTSARPSTGRSFRISGAM